MSSEVMMNKYTSPQATASKNRYVTNRNMSYYVAHGIPFENHKGTCFGYRTVKFVHEPVTGQLEYSKTIGYACFSYGSHFPIYYYDFDADVWVGNKDKYSRTTSRHQSMAMPCDPERIAWVDTTTLQCMVNRGYVDAVAERMGVND